jgi:hypothetical protein
VPHIDGDTLSLLALGEPASPKSDAHLHECPFCSDELATLSSVVRAVRDDSAVPRIAPPPEVWQHIARSTGVHSTVRPNLVLANATPSAPRRRFRSRPSGRALAVAASCLLVGLVLGTIGGRFLDDGGGAGPTASDSTAVRPLVLAATALIGLAAQPAAAGQADVVETSSGRQLNLDVHKLSTPNGFYEVWLINPAVTKMVAVGVLTGNAGRFALPSDVNIAGYPLVDVSIEPMDGNPAHSGKSVLRGTLRS